MKGKKEYKKTEEKILDYFKEEGAHFYFDGSLYYVRAAGKPKSTDGGEPKTDVYAAVENKDNKELKEFKISIKQGNADFLENKMSSERAREILGENWKSIICSSTLNIRKSFCSRPLIYTHKFSHTQAGSITLGWKFELVNKNNGELSSEVKLTQNQLIDIYSGTNLSDGKRNANVNGRIVPNSGIANYMLVLDEDKTVNSIQSTINALVCIDDYAKKHPKIFFACKALNYRTFSGKWDGNRPLAVYIDWFASDGNLDQHICFDSPLIYGGNEIVSRLKGAMESLGVSTTKDLNNSNVKDPTKIYNG